MVEGDDDVPFGLFRTFRHPQDLSDDVDDSFLEVVFGDIVGILTNRDVYHDGERRTLRSWVTEVDHHSSLDDAGQATVRNDRMATAGIEARVRPAGDEKVNLDRLRPKRSDDTEGILETENGRLSLKFLDEGVDGVWFKRDLSVDKEMRDVSEFFPRADTAEKLENGCVVGASDHWGSCLKREFIQTNGRLALSQQAVNYEIPNQRKYFPNQKSITVCDFFV